MPCALRSLAPPAEAFNRNRGATGMCADLCGIGVASAGSAGFPAAGYSAPCELTRTITIADAARCALRALRALQVQRRQRMLSDSARRRHSFNVLARREA